MVIMMQMSFVASLIWSAVVVWRLKCAIAAGEEVRFDWRDHLTGWAGAPMVWLLVWVVLGKLGLGGWFGDLASLTAGLWIAFALEDVSRAPNNQAGKNKREAGRDRLIMAGALMALTMVFGPGLASKAQRAKRAVEGQLAGKATLSFDQAKFLGGMVRDADYVSMRAQRPVGLVETWNATALQAAATVPAAKELVAGYTVLLAEAPTDQTRGWVKADGLPVEVRAYLGELWQAQQVADSTKWPGHWVDPNTGRPLPLRFYRVSGATKNDPDKYIRVAGADVKVGPKGEMVYDLSLYWGTEKTFPDGTKMRAEEVVMKGATNLATPYTGGRAPNAGLKGLIWN